VVQGGVNLPGVSERDGIKPVDLTGAKSRGDAVEPNEPPHFFAKERIESPAHDVPEQLVRGGGDAVEVDGGGNGGKFNSVDVVEKGQHERGELHVGKKKNNGGEYEQDSGNSGGGNSKDKTNAMDVNIGTALWFASRGQGRIMSIQEAETLEAEFQKNVHASTQHMNRTKKEGNRSKGGGDGQNKKKRKPKKLFQNRFKHHFINQYLIFYFLNTILFLFYL
jgi:hypothetical protein